MACLFDGPGAHSGPYGHSISASGILGHKDEDVISFGSSLAAETPLFIYLIPPTNPVGLKAPYITTPSVRIQLLSHYQERT